MGQTAVWWVRTRINGWSRESHISSLDLASHQITTLPGLDGKFSPHWSPDGQFISAISLDISTISVFDIKTQHWSALYEKSNFAFERWSGDSRSIYCFSTANDPTILRIPVTGGQARIVAPVGFPFTGTWSLWFGLGPTDAPLGLV